MKTIHVRWIRHPWGDAIEFPPLPRSELIRNGSAADYMFEQMGEQNSRVGGTEYGDQFDLVRKSGDRFKLKLRLFREAVNPFRLRAVDPYQTDISKILASVQVGGAS